MIEWYWLLPAMMAGFALGLGIAVTRMERKLRR